MSQVSPLQWMNIIAEDSLLLDRLIQQEMNSDVVLVKQISTYIIQSGGKRLRPKVLLLIANAFGYSGQNHITLAAIIEFIHVATLLHDDVVDQSDTRRGQPSANHTFNNSAAVLVGDFLYSRAFQLMTRVKHPVVFDILSNTTNRISEGEVMQLMHVGDSELSEQDYFDIIERKTACLFEAACWLGTLIAEGNQQQIQYSRQYGHSLGMAFQIVDDLLDYTADAKTLGKSLGDDLKEGKTTLPLIKLMAQVGDEDKRRIKQAIEQPSEDNHNNLLMIIDQLKKTDIIDQIQTQIKHFTHQAKEACTHLPDNDFTQSLHNLSVEVMGRSH